MGNQKKIFKDAIEKYGEERILGTFVYNSIKYNITKNENDLVYCNVYIPTFEELCVTQPKIRAEEHENTYTIDIRDFYLYFKYNLVSTIEIFYNEDSIINDKFLFIYNETLKKNSEILNKKDWVYNMIKKGEKVLNEEDNMLDVAIVLMQLDMYFSGSSYEDIFTLNKEYQRQYLSLVNSKKIEIDKNSFLEIFKDYLIKINEQEDDDIKNIEILENCIVKIIKASYLGENEKNIFVDSLSICEKNAFNILIEKLKDNNIISISKLIKETSISRPVYKNLLYKMEKDNIAKITNMGVKGTLIELLDIDF